MNDLFDYLYWRGDLTFEQDSLNEVDALIFSEFSYIDFQLLASEALDAGKLTIQEAANQWKKANRKDFMPTGYLHHEKAYEALLLAGDSDRFKDLVIAEDIKYFSAEDESQFGVTLFHREGRPFFIAFEGTDLRSLAWKEDLQMSYLPQVPSQKIAAEFLTAHFDRYPFPVAIGGHSKGSNLAIYAAIFLGKEKQPLIQTIYSFDGPGFMKELMENESYKEMEPKIQSFVPQDSLIGLLLHKLEEPNIIYSHAEDSNQHDVFTWDVHGNRFVSSELTQSAEKIQQIINDLLDELSSNDLEHFSEALFTIIGDSEDDYIMGDRQFRIERIPKMITEFRNLNIESRKILLKVLSIFYRKRLEIL